MKKTPKHNRVTIEDIRKNPEYRNLGMEEAEKILENIRTISNIIYKIITK